MSIYEKLGVRKVINAAGWWTILGGAIDSEAQKVMIEAANSFVDMEELHKKACDTIAEITGAEAGYVTSGAAAGLVLATAACMTGVDQAKIEQLPNTKNLKNEVIIQKGHRNQYDNMIRITGAKLIEVGTASRTLLREIEDAINEKTAAIAYFIRAGGGKKGLLPLEEIIKIAKKHDVPTIVDAAAELPPVENLKKFIGMGADLVVFSGGKAIQGPNATGILCGRKDLIEACVLQGYVGFEATGCKTIGRPMKVGKESIIGLIVALQKYVEKDQEAEFRSWNAKAKYIVDGLKALPNVEVKRVLGNSVELDIPYAQLSLNEKALCITTDDVINKLKKGEPSIWVHSHQGKILINSATLSDGEEKIIVRRLKEILTE